MKYKSRRFDFLPKEVYDSLPKKDLDRLDRYREQYRKVVLRENMIKRREDKLLQLKDELKDMKMDLTSIGGRLDYLRNNFSFSVSISPLPPRGKSKMIYYNISIPLCFRSNGPQFGSNVGLFFTMNKIIKSKYSNFH